MPESERQEVEVVIGNPLGLHTRPARAFVVCASRFAAQIQVRKVGRDSWVNGKSIMGLMALLAPEGTHLILAAEGADAGEAVAALATLVEAQFGEPE